MATLNLKGNTTVAELKKAFNEAFGSQIKVYNWWYRGWRSDLTFETRLERVWRT